MFMFAGITTLIALIAVFIWGFKLGRRFPKKVK